VPGFPERIAARFSGVFPWFHRSAQARNVEIARSLPTISRNVFGRYFSVQSSICYREERQGILRFVLT